MKDIFHFMDAVQAAGPTQAKSYGATRPTLQRKPALVAHKAPVKRPRQKSQRRTDIFKKHLKRRVLFQRIPAEYPNLVFSNTELSSSEVRTLQECMNDEPGREGNSRLVGAEVVAKFYGVKPQTIYSWAQLGWIPAYIEHRAKFKFDLSVLAVHMLTQAIRFSQELMSPVGVQPEKPRVLKNLKGKCRSAIPEQSHVSTILEPTTNTTPDFEISAEPPVVPTTATVEPRHVNPASHVDANPKE